MQSIRNFSLLFFLVVLSACQALPDWMGASEEDTPLPGERISVLEHTSNLQSDPAIEKVKIRLPGVQNNNLWPNQNIAPISHPALKKLSDKSTFDVGSAAEEDYQITSTPVIANGLIYILDADGNVSARNVNDPKKIIWKVTIESGVMDADFLNLGLDIGIGNKKVKKDFLGGNIAYGNKAIFVTTGRGDVIALGSVTGTKIWRRSVKMPVKSSPFVYGNKLFLITTDNRLYAINTKTGDTIWTHAGIKETTSLFGSPSPVAEDGIVIVPYSSGEIYALNVETGTRLWSDMLISGTSRTSSSVVLNDINATPVISNKRVYAVSNEGVFIASDLVDGTKLWSINISALNTPWVAGNFVYLLTTNNELVCIYAPDGKVKWVSQLESRAAPKLSWSGSKGEKLVWSGPVLAGDRLLLTNSHGEMVSLSPYTGKITDKINIPDDVYLPPIVASGKVFTLSNNAELMMLH